MPQVPTERRDTTVLDQIFKMQDKLDSMGRELATNTTKTDGINARLDKLNGSIAKHETQLHLIEQTVALNTNHLNALTATEEKQQEKEEKKQDATMGMWRRNADKVLWGALALLGVAVWRLLILLENSGHLKDLIK